jgi:gluconolactonase
MRRLVDGRGFAEGPVIGPGGELTFTDFRRNCVMRWSPDTGLKRLAVMQRPNGAARDTEGRLLVCEGGQHRLCILGDDGITTTLADRFEGKRLNSPNDVISTPDGSIYFTDPPWMVTPEERELDFAGVYRLDKDGALTLLADDLPYPNGLAFSPDGSVLYVSQSRPPETRRLQAYDVRGDGSLSGSRVFAWMLTDEDGVPDGMKVHPNGTIVCTGPGGAWLFRPDGEPLGLLVAPEVPSNCVFSADYRTLYLTARTSVYAVGTEGLHGVGG